MIKKVIVIVISIIVGFSYPTLSNEFETAVLAGGCFWCLEHDLENLQGVIAVDSGYSGGHLKNPSYRDVTSENTGHQEAVKVKFDPSIIPFEKLLRIYWRNIDPLDGGGQFCDRGDSYRPVIFVKNETQKQLAESSLSRVANELNINESEIKVKIKDASDFWVAEKYHQDFAKRNYAKYSYYRFRCGRDRRLVSIWNDRAKTSLPWLNNKYNN